MPSLPRWAIISIAISAGLLLSAGTLAFVLLCWPTSPPAETASAVRHDLPPAVFDARSPESTLGWLVGLTAGTEDAKYKGNAVRDQMLAGHLLKQLQENHGETVHWKAVVDHVGPLGKDGAVYIWLKPWGYPCSSEDMDVVPDRVETRYFTDQGTFIPDGLRVTHYSAHNDGFVLMRPLLPSWYFDPVMLTLHEGSAVRLHGRILELRPSTWQWKKAAIKCWEVTLDHRRLTVLGEKKVNLRPYIAKPAEPPAASQPGRISPGQGGMRELLQQKKHH